MGRETSLFVGGCYRSGTTLVEKLLHQHAEICVSSQPFPDLYFYIKALFDRERGLEPRYPLGHKFLERGYASEDLHAFLDTRRLSGNELDEMLDRMAANALGLWTPEILRERSRVRAGTFWEIYRQLNRLAAEINGKAHCAFIGGKEVLCEEYAPYLVGRGARVILIVRDPRDMISSLDFRRRDNKTGDDRPVLFSLRIWRKSVAICLAFADRPGFAWVRYEDLASDPRGQMGRLAGFLGVDPFPDSVFAGGIRDQDGTLWKGNSSFVDQEGVATSSIGRYAASLPEEVLAFIEACCRPEMRCLGYESVASNGFDEAAIRRYRDPFAPIHASFPENYSSDPVRAEEEISRYRTLTTAIPSPEAQRRWFLYEKAYSRLAAVVSES